MAEETDFLKKMQGVHAAQSADAKRTLNSLLFEFEPALAQFPALRQEVQRAMDSVGDLDLAVIVERLRIVLQTASRLVVEIDTLDEVVRHHPEMEKLIEQTRTNSRLSSIGVYADKFKEVQAFIVSQKAEEVRKEKEAARIAEEARKAEEEARKARGAPGAEFKDCDDGPVMVVVPAGNFMMGSPKTEEGRFDSEGPQHRVTIPRPFAVGKYPVTVAQWNVFLQATGYAESYAWEEQDAFPQTSSHPVVNINWHDAKAYVEWLSHKTGKDYRLLSEAEWEYAARAGTQTPYPFPLAAISKHANCSGKACGYEYTSPVGSFPANAFGLYDMIGNVWEWVEDCYDGSYDGAPGDGQARIIGDGDATRVLRGGSWNNNPRILRAACRSDDAPANRDDGIGFRVARTVP